MTFQYLTCFPPSLGQDFVATIGFQRVLAIADNASTSSDAIKRTSTALQDLLRGWGRHSTEWNDLCRVLDFYSFPVPSSDDEQKIQKQIKNLAQHACVSTKLLVELLCALQSICLQRLTNTIQYNYRKSMKSVQHWKNRVAVLDKTQTQSCESQSNYALLESKNNELSLQLIDFQDVLNQVQSELDSTRRINKELESAVLQAKWERIQDQTKNKQFRKYSKSEILDLESEVAVLRQRLLNSESSKSARPYARKRTITKESSPSLTPSEAEKILIISSQLDSPNDTPLIHQDSLLIKMKNNLDIVEHPDMNQVLKSDIQLSQDVLAELEPVVLHKRGTVYNNAPLRTKSLTEPSRFSFESKRTSHCSSTDSLRTSAKLTPLICQNFTQEPQELKRISLKLSVLTKYPETQSKSVIESYHLESTTSTEKSITSQKSDNASNISIIETHQVPCLEFNSSGSTQFTTHVNTPKLSQNSLLEPEIDYSTEEVREFVESNPTIIHDAEFMHYLHVLIDSTNCDEPVSQAADPIVSDEDRIVPLDTPNSEIESIVAYNKTLASTRKSLESCVSASSHIVSLKIVKKNGLLLKTRRSILAMSVLFRSDSKKSCDEKKVDELDCGCVELTHDINEQIASRWWQRTRKEAI